VVIALAAALQIGVGLGFGTWAFRSLQREGGLTHLEFSVAADRF
jgi:hypothetical protein